MERAKVTNLRLISREPHTNEGCKGIWVRRLSYHALSTSGIEYPLLVETRKRCELTDDSKGKEPEDSVLRENSVPL